MIGLDIGCGWGPVLNHLRSIKAKGTGIIFSQGQYEACKRKGFDDMKLLLLFIFK